MEFPQPHFEKEQQVLTKAKNALAMLDDQEHPLALGMADLLAGYEELLDRTRRVSELAMAVQLELEDMESQVSRLAQVDGLTGALNRRSFEKLLARDGGFLRSGCSGFIASLGSPRSCPFRRAPWPF